MCARTGDVLFEQKEVPEGKQGFASTWATTLYTTGGWTRVVRDHKGHVTRESYGCMPAQPLGAVRSALARATWRSERATVVCEAIGASYVAYASLGKHLWDQHVCGADQLDAGSQKSLHEIILLVAEATKPVDPPCCKK